MIMKTSFLKQSNSGESPVGDLVEYLDKSVGLFDRCGCEVDEPQKERFLDETTGDEMGRLITASPENSEEYTDDELSRATRHALEDYLAGKYSAEYVLAIHRDTDNPHTQVALSGSQEDLRMEQDDIDELKQGIIHNFEQEQQLDLKQVQLNGQELDEEIADRHVLEIASLTDSRFDQTQELEQQELSQVID